MTNMRDAFAKAHAAQTKEAERQERAGPANNIGPAREEMREALISAGALREDEILGEQTQPRIEPSYGSGEVLKLLHPRLRDALSKTGIEQIYTHQEDAIRNGLEGANIVLQAPTASGKSLAFQVPVIDTLLKNPSAKALFVYPMKALAFDQRRQLEELTAPLGNSYASWWYDGDTPREERDAIRKSPPKILITNPEMLNGSFLGYSEQWEEKFLSKIKWIVIDEVHEYRGYFGSNVSLLLRRLNHKLRQIGSRPQMFLCSATCANAKRHAENLTGLKFTEVSATRSLRPEQDFYFIKPQLPEYKFSDRFLYRIVLAGLTCMKLGQQVIVFGPSRKFVEDCHRTASGKCAEWAESGEAKLDPKAIRVFRGGLLPEQRQDIQREMKAGNVRLIFSTNALELGIDIGGLDGVILAGFPDTIMAAWQRIGRAGRDWRSKAFVLYYASNSALDAFYVHNLSTFLNKPLDELVANPENKTLIERHVPALLYECKEIDTTDRILGEGLSREAQRLNKSGVQPVRTGRFRPHMKISFRGMSGGKFTLKAGGVEIGEMSSEQQFREAFPQAIYLHGGRTYEVENVTIGGRDGEVHLKPTEPYLRTRPYLFTMLSVSEIYAGKQWEDFQIYYGRVSATEILQSVQKVDERTGQVLDRWSPQTSGAQNRRADAMWVQLPGVGDEGSDGLEALQHILRIGLQFTIPADLHDVFSHHAKAEQEAYIVESYPGGIGVVKSAYEQWQTVVETGKGIAVECSCSSGCPHCILPARTPDGFDKQEGIRLAQRMLEQGAQPAGSVYHEGMWTPL